MSADLTCPGCNGARIIPGGVPCARCLGDGRRPPTHPEWDALVGRCERAERNLQSERAHGELVQGLHERACNERNALKAERDRLHRVVATYGDHLEECVAAESEDESKCDCGWTHACVRSFEFAGQEYLTRAALDDLKGGA